MNPAALRRTAGRARRSTAKRNALSRWRVERAAAGGEIDPATGDWAPTSTVVVWEGAAHFSTSGRPFVRSRQDTALTVEQPTLCVTADVPRFMTGDVVTAIKVDDSSLLARSWRIVGEPGSSYGVRRHYPLEEVTHAGQG